ncbi:MAG: hypothetical protein PHV37_07440 [Candidatus Gastranaerophilales bacterium]|nr:hypothetical protein [Candidatus Gastranaerophilales bacterium]
MEKDNINIYETLINIEELMQNIKNVATSADLYCLFLKTKAIICKYDCIKKIYDEKIENFKKLREDKVYILFMKDLLSEAKIFTSEDIDKFNFTDSNSEKYCDLFCPNTVYIDENWGIEQSNHLKIQQKLFKNNHEKAQDYASSMGFGLLFYYSSLVSKNGDVKILAPVFTFKPTDEQWKEMEKRGIYPPMKFDVVENGADEYFIHKLSPDDIEFIKNDENMCILLKIALYTTLFHIKNGVEYGYKNNMDAPDKIMELLKLNKHKITFQNIDLLEKFTSIDVKNIAQKEVVEDNAIHQRVARLISKFEGLGILELLQIDVSKRKDKKRICTKILPYLKRLKSE